MMNMTASRWQMVNIQTIYCILLGTLQCHLVCVVIFPVEQVASEDCNYYVDCRPTGNSSLFFVVCHIAAL